MNDDGLNPHNSSSIITPLIFIKHTHTHTQSWKGFNDALEEWKKVNEGGEFWSLVSQSWGGDTGTGHRALLALLHLAFCSKGKCD